MQQHGPRRHESKDTAVPDGLFGHWRHHEHIYPSGTGGCPERDGAPGRTEPGQGRSGESRRREEAGDAEKLQSSLIWERKNERSADRVGQQGFSVAGIFTAHVLIYHSIYQF